MTTGSIAETRFVTGSALADEEAIETSSQSPLHTDKRFAGSALADEEAIETGVAPAKRGEQNGQPAVPWPMRRPLKPRSQSSAT